MKITFPLQFLLTLQNAVILTILSDLAELSVDIDLYGFQIVLNEKFQKTSSTSDEQTSFKLIKSAGERVNSLVRSAEEEYQNEIGLPLIPYNIAKALKLFQFLAKWPGHLEKENKDQVLIRCMDKLQKLLEKLKCIE